jgi:hypothetical protein
MISKLRQFCSAIAYAWSRRYVLNKNKWAERLRARKWRPIIYRYFKRDNIDTHHISIWRAGLHEKLHQSSKRDFLCFHQRHRQNPNQHMQTIAVWCPRKVCCTINRPDQSEVSYIVMILFYWMSQSALLLSNYGISIDVSIIKLWNLSWCYYYHFSLLSQLMLLLSFESELLEL